eukprot:766674-Hanusia_phi.AAC.3
MRVRGRRVAVMRAAGGIAGCAALLLCSVYVASRLSSPSSLQSCTPCTGGEGCIAGCRLSSVALAHTQLLADTRLRARRIPNAEHESMHAKRSRIEILNEQLLRINRRQASSPSEKTLGSMLDSAVGDILRAEGDEVKMRRQVRLAHGESVPAAYKSLRLDSPLCESLR